jgi:hypothetical protein
MSDTGFTPSTQIKFYQGYIRDKGTKSGFDALTSASFNNVSGDVTVNEEWAFRVGSYGAVDSSQYVDVILDEARFNKQSTIFTFVDDLDDVEDDTTLCLKLFNRHYCREESDEEVSEEEEEDEESEDSD